MRTIRLRLAEFRHQIAEWHFSGGISRRIAWSTVAMTILMAGGISLMSFGALYWVLRQNANTELDAASRLVQQQFEDELNHLTADLSALAQSAATGSTPSARSTLQRLLKERKPTIAHAVTLVLYDLQGHPLGANLLGNLQAFDDNNEIQRAIETGLPRAGILPATNRQHMLQLAYPIALDAGRRIEGALLGVVDLDALFQNSTRQLDAKIRSDYLAIGFPADLRRAWRADTGTLQRTWKANLVTPLDGLDLQVRIKLPEARAFSPLPVVLAAFIAFDLLLVLLALQFARRAARQLALPIANLSRTASQIATSGSFDLKAEVSGQDEVAILGRTFNNMLDRLRSSYAQLQAREGEFKALVENSPDLIARFDRQFRCVYVSSVVQSYFGLAPEQVIGRTVHELGIRKDLLPSMARLFKEGGESVHEYSARNRHFEVRFIPEHDNEGEVASLLAIIREVTAQRNAEDNLRLANRAIASSANPIMIASCLEPDYPIKYVNPAFERITGYSAAEAIGRNCRFLQGDDHAQPELEQVRVALRDQNEVRVVLRNYRKDGSLFWNELYIAPVTDAGGVVTHFVGEINDVTASRAQQEQLHHQATHDTLTGLPNRSLLTDRLIQAISHAQRNQRVVAVAFLDLDKFKFINDSLGHDVGDQLLKIVAQRLGTCVRESDTVARLGGDEFVLVLYDQINEDVTYHVLQRLLHSIAQPVTLADREFTVTCSLGFAVYPQDGRDAETLLKNADTAMYRAKELGRANFQFYTDELHTRINERLALEAGLRRALERDEFILHYQPRVDLGTGKVSGMEALVRWRHPELGMVPPLRFISLAEEIGLIHQIGDWVMRSACLQHMAWRRDDVADMPVAVNVSAPQFLQKDFAATVAKVLNDTGIEPARLELEITESLSMRDPVATMRVMQELKDMGIKLSIDDFGTGYSNLSYLKRFPVDKIKLDQSFVRDITSNHEDLAISDAVIAMAHSLRLKVTAEGVESASQLALLADHGCDEMQGYYFSRPLSSEACTALLRARQSLPLEQLGRQHVVRTLLLVDDEPHVLSALGRLLAPLGYRILKANNAMEAFDLLATHEVGVILCDHRMPGITGVEFFSQVRYMYPSTVRIILSGYSDTNLVTDAINLGAVSKFLNKPWDPNELCEILDETFENYELAQRMASVV